MSSPRRDRAINGRATSRSSRARSSERASKNMLRVSWAALVHTTIRPDGPLPSSIRMWRISSKVNAWKPERGRRWAPSRATIRRFSVRNIEAPIPRSTTRSASGGTSPGRAGSDRPGPSASLRAMPRGRSSLGNATHPEKFL
jgi:hypothetical protein